MKSVAKFIRATLTGGILFLLPLALLIIVLEKPYELLRMILEPLDRMLPDRILGLDGRMILTVLLLVTICFVSGLLFMSPPIKRLFTRLEESVLSLIPGYSMIKSITADFLGESVEHRMTPVLVQDGDDLRIGFLVEEGEGLCTVFFPDAPRLDAGEVKIVPAAAVQQIEAPTAQVIQSLKNFGAGALSWVKKTR
jgi:uncharacterized membrane protein